MFKQLKILCSEQLPLLLLLLCTLLYMSYGFFQPRESMLAYMFYGWIILACNWIFNHFRQQTIREFKGDKSRGIAGWLLFYLIVKTVLVYIDVHTETLRFVFMMWDGFRIEIFLHILCEIIYLCAFLYSLYLLGTLHKKAISVTKVMLIINALHGIISPLLLALIYALTGYLSFPGVSGYMHIGNDLAIGIFSLAWSIVWYWYFVVSERIAQTWPQSKNPAATSHWHRPSWFSGNKSQQR